jgi:hypothetical protein
VSQQIRSSQKFGGTCSSSSAKTQQLSNKSMASYVSGPNVSPTSSLRYTSRNTGFQDYPVLPYHEIMRMWPMCCESWRNIELTGLMSGLTLRDTFEFHVSNSLGSMKSDGGAMVALLRKSRITKSVNLVSHVMRYVARKRPDNEDVFVRQLMMLGREHARIGVTPEMIISFCGILINSLTACIRDYDACESVIRAWKANLKYVVTHMTAVRFRFLRTVSGKVTCSRCEGRGGRSTGLCLDCGTMYATHSQTCANKKADMETAPVSVISRSSSCDAMSYACSSIPDSGDSEQARSFILYRPQSSYSCCWKERNETGQVPVDGVV